MTVTGTYLKRRPPWSLRWLAVLSSPFTPALVFANGDHSEGDSLFGVIYVSALALATIVVLIVIAWLQRRERNPSTGLPRPVKRRRARGPFKTGPLS